MQILDEKLRAPALKGVDWLSEPPVTLADLRGQRVVLLDFWDYTCINCLRTLPYLKTWHERYEALGLTVIGLHAPEFAFAHNHDRVREAVQDLGISYPVALDNAFQTWQAYANKAWPAKYLIDAAGYIRAFHRGEGAYEPFEGMIQTLLREVQPEASFPAILPARDAIDTSGAVCYRPTPELYLGYGRGIIGNPEGNPRESTLTYAPVTGEPSTDTVYLQGPWQNRKEHLQSVSTEPARITLHYQAAEVNLVMASTDDTATSVRLCLNGETVSPENRGADVALVEAETVIQVDTPRLYRLLSHRNFQSGTLTLDVATPGLQAYAFTFGTCLMSDSTPETDR
jgi:thiol-disulfide isomerase/thioredoxin